MQKFVEIMAGSDFMMMHSPKITSEISSKGGSAVFKLLYPNGKTAALAQSPQLYKQMAINGGYKKVFEIGPVFRAEKSKTHRHLCEYIGLHAEMEIDENYLEV
jgi:aspartyl-tRNA synthetase